MEFLGYFRLARAGPRSEPTTYETISFNGSFRRADSAPRGMRSNNYPAGLQMLRRPRCGRDDSIPLHSIGGNDIVSIFELISHQNQFGFALIPFFNIDVTFCRF